VTALAEAVEPVVDHADGDGGGAELAAFVLTLSLRASRRGPLIAEAMRQDIEAALLDMEE